MRGCGCLSRFNKIKIIKIILEILCYLTFLIGIFFTITLLFPIKNKLMSNFSFFITQISGFLMFLYIPALILLLKLKIRKHSRKKWKKAIILAIGTFLVVSNALPLISTPISVQIAENEFNHAYGSNWRSKIPSRIESYFLPSQFNLYILFK